MKQNKFASLNLYYHLDLMCSPKGYNEILDGSMPIVD